MNALLIPKLRNAKWWLCRVDLCEVFSPPRVGKDATKFGLQAGDAMDLTTGWDFNREEHRVIAEERLEKQKPLVLIGSPPCVAFSQLQTPIPDMRWIAKRYFSFCDC